MKWLNRARFTRSGAPANFEGFVLGVLVVLVLGLIVRLLGG